MKQACFRRGDPLLVVLLVLTVWFGARAAIGQVPAAMTQSWHSLSWPATGQMWERMGALKAAEAPSVAAISKPFALHLREQAGLGDVAAKTSIAGSIAEKLNSVGLETAAIAPDPVEQLPTGYTERIHDVSGPGKGIGNAAIEQPLVTAPASRLVSEGTLANPVNASPFPKSRYRWTADGWVYVRGGTIRGGANNGGVASYAGYGGSQVGAVLRYALGRGKLDPTAYMRMSGSLGSGVGSYREVSAGVSVRPLASIPLSVAGELRSQQSAVGVTLRPAATIVSHIAPLNLPGGWRAEIYGQAGYVAGKDATAFYDGQATVDHHIGAVGKSGSMRAGAGVWAGGQAGASRIDIGPTASVRLPAGRAAVRVSADWRVQVSGNAQPGSGLAATVAAGF